MGNYTYIYISYLNIFEAMLLDDHWIVGPISMATFSPQGPVWAISV